MRSAFFASVMILSSPAWSAESCGDKMQTPASSRIENELKLARRLIEFNLFTTGRSLEDYKRTFSALPKALKNLPPNATWVDLGAGHGTALMDFAYSEVRPDVQLVAISVKRPEKFRNRNPKNFRYLEGRIEELNADSIGKAYLITDLLGAISYSENVDQALLKALSMLKVGGDLFINYEPSFTKIRAGWFKSYDLWGYLEMGTGFKMVHDDVSHEVLHLQRTSEYLSLPELELRKFRATTPSERLYRLKQSVD